jgi:hypothetical protein
MYFIIKVAQAFVIKRIELVIVMQVYKKNMVINHFINTKYI